MLVRPRFAARLLAPVAACAALALIATPAAGAGARAGGLARRDARCSRSCPAPAPAGPVAPGDEDPSPAFRWALDALDARSRGCPSASAAPSQGTYDREQAFLDITQGTRVSLKSYDPTAPPPLELRPRRRGRRPARGLAGGRARAARAPAELQPGLLAADGPRWRGLRGRSPGARTERRSSPPTARARIAQLSLGGAGDVVRRARGLLERRALVVAGPPVRAPRRRRALDALVARRRAGELLLVMQTPPGGTDAQLLPLGALGLGGTPGGRLTSQTTHTDGVVAGIDIAPTVLRAPGGRGPRRRQGPADHLRARTRRRRARAT